MGNQEKEKSKLTITPNQLGEVGARTTPYAVDAELEDIKKGEHKEFEIENK